MDAMDVDSGVDQGRRRDPVNYGDLETGEIDEPSSPHRNESSRRDTARREDPSRRSRSPRRDDRRSARGDDSRDWDRNKERERDRDRDRERERDRERDRDYRRDRDRDRDYERDRDRDYRKGRDEDKRGNRYEENDSGSSRGGGDVIELSVEETNALRAKLGLAPLEMDTKPRIDRAEAKKLEADKRAAEEQRIKLLETEERIRLAKEARMSRSFRSYTQHNRLYNETNTAFAGGANKKRKTLADSDSEDDAASWILKSRELEQEKKLAAKREKARLEAELKAMEELEKEDVIESSAVKVVHDIDDLDEGREVIMTLKDQRILDQGDENDELENVQLAEKEKLTKVLDAKKRKNRYDKFDEDGNPKGVLSKYDDEKQKAGFVLKGTGSVELSEEAKQSQLDKIRAKLQDSAPGKVTYSFTDDAPKKEMSDTYTEDELVAFAKPKKTKKKTTKKKLRTTKSETLAALAEEAGTEELGSRQEREQRQKEREREAMRDNAEQFKKYEKATNQANEDAKFVFEDDNDDELFASLSRAREASRQKKGTDDILKSVEEAAKRRQEEESRETDGLVITPVMEFVRNVPTGDELEEDEEEKPFVIAPPPAKRIKSTESDDEDMDIDEPSGVRVKEEPIEESPTILGDEPLVKGGMAATLAMMRSRGFRDEENLSKTVRGRLADERLRDDLNKPGDAARLEYRDEYGREMTPREAFRVMSQAFHGKFTGKNKKEATERKIKRQEKILKKSSTESALAAVAGLQKTQRNTKSPFVVISGTAQKMASIRESAAAANIELDAKAKAKKVAAAGKPGAPPSAARPKVAFQMTGPK